LEEYQGIVTSDLVAVDGAIPLPWGPGLGIELQPSVFSKPGVKLDRSSR